ncbi:MAG: ABC transporter ATP-binding protein [Actinobacteria bacterium]|nr:ABC transporter ATP-binding protein [Actinomycetota bacterium]
MTPSVVLRDLRVVRGGTAALRGVTLDVESGRITGLVGPSGSGKTTLIRSIAGVQRLTGGSVRVLDQPAGSARLRGRVAYMTQSPSVYADVTVRENLAFFARILRAEGEIDAVVATVGLEEHRDQVVATLSGGERARVSLAAALLGRPDVLLLDEPTVGLDPVLRRDLWATFAGVAAGGATVIVSSHVMDEAERCDHLVLLRDGGVLASATPAALRDETGARDLDGAFLVLIERTADR